jgi:hypothetical protein
MEREGMGRSERREKKGWRKDTTEKKVRVE